MARIYIIQVYGCFACNVFFLRKKKKNQSLNKLIMNFIDYSHCFEPHWVGSKSASVTDVFGECDRYDRPSKRCRRSRARIRALLCSVGLFPRRCLSRPVFYHNRYYCYFNFKNRYILIRPVLQSVVNLYRN